MDPSSSRSWKYDVFPSFHGADVRIAFLSHVLKEFKGKGIDIFIDNDIERSKTIGPELIEAIRGSRITIVLLSENYASSTWCLNELAEIMNCRRELGQTVVVIFYKVNPSDVKKQTGKFGKVFLKTCDGKKEENMKIWREALAQVATIAGYHSSNWCNEADMIEQIASNVSNTLNSSIPSNDFEELVGIEAHMEKMRSLLSLECNEVRMVGLCGPAGIGKTTIARAVYETLRSNFTHTAFMLSIKGVYTVQNRDNYALKLQLQEQLLCETLNQKDLKIRHLGVAPERLKDKKVLVVLDDVDQLAQLDATAKETLWFGPGSRILITTQDQKILRTHGIDHIYNVDYPTDEEALQIFCLYAFDQKSPKDGFDELAREVTERSGNLPLGLSVMGSYFRGMSKEEWTNALPRLRTRLHKDIKNILRFSFDALCDEDQELFLYIACFFNLKSIQTLEDFLGNTFLDVSQGLHILAEKSLISRKYGFIKMPSLLVQLGREIVRNQSVQEPGKRQFLVDAREICQVLTEERGSGSLVGMDLDLSEITGEFNISERCFERMCNLQFLRVYVKFEDSNGIRLYSPQSLKYLSPKLRLLPQSLKYLSPKLRLLHWEYFPVTSFPSSFIPEFLVEINMRYSKLKRLWKGVQPLQNLKWVDLSYSKNLVKLPDLSTAINLLSLDVSQCPRLKKLPSSIGNASNLLILNIEYCSSLVNIPTTIGNIPNLKIFLAECSSLVQLPSCIWNITSLNTFNLDNFSSSAQQPLMWIAKNFQVLDLSGCSSLKKLPPIVNATDLQKLNLNGYSNLVEFSSSVGNVTNLRELNLTGCSSLMKLPLSIENATKLLKLNLTGCSSLMKLPLSIENATNLRKLNLTGCSSLMELPLSIENATNLRTLNLTGCSSLMELPLSIKNARLRKLNLTGCSSLKELPSFIENATKFWGFNLIGCPSSLRNATKFRKIIYDQER
ncbi:Disease resistance protein TAO1 [Cardamine amara subsp. amara]|uniref:ADP-ribosyl cyclase/cyclic ADP-ribose hydrolase n=1 Tax=Cardamine amara subsp. amara TaxID=228776 RepID=A0ABD1ABM2_CARAN